MKLSENPMGALLQMREARVGPVRMILQVVLMASCAGFCLAYLFSGALGASSYAVVLAALGLLAIPAFRAQVDGSVLSSFRKGGCVDEVLSTRVSPAEMVDGVIFHAFRWSATIGLPVYVLIVPIAAFGGGPAELGWAAVGWLPALLALTVAESYLVLVATAWSRRDRIAPLQFVALAVVTGPLACLMVLSIRLYDAFGLAGPVVLGAAGLTWLVLIGREAAIAGLVWSDRIQQDWSVRWKAWSARLPRLPIGVEDPLMYREGMRRSGRFPLEPLMLIVPFALPWLLGFEPYVAWLTWLALAALATARVAFHNAGAVVEERESGTLSAVALTPLPPAAYLDGYAMATWVHVAAELTVAAPLLAFVFVSCDVWLGQVLLLLPLLYLLALGGSYLGLAASAGAANRADARGKLVGSLVVWIPVMGGIWAALYVLGLIFGGYPGYSCFGNGQDASTLNFGSWVAGVLLGTVWVCWEARRQALRELDTRHDTRYRARAKGLTLDSLPR